MEKCPSKMSKFSFFVHFVLWASILIKEIYCDSSDQLEKSELQNCYIKKFSSTYCTEEVLDKMESFPKLKIKQLYLYTYEVGINNFLTGYDDYFYRLVQKYERGRKMALLRIFSGLNKLSKICRFQKNPPK